MSEDQFTKLFKYMTEQFSELRREMDSQFTDVNQKIDRLCGAVDTVLKNQEVEQHERLAMGHQLDRQDNWITRAARHIGVPYEGAA